MGVILSSRRYNAQGDKVVVEVLLGEQEMRQLRGEINDVYLFSERVADVPSRVSLRGKNEATKYFLIPRKLRKTLPVFGAVGCQRIDVQEKFIFVYVLNRDAAIGKRHCMLSE